MSEEDTENSLLLTGVDLQLETSGILAFYSDFITAERQPPPRMNFYDGNNTLFCSVTGRAYDTPEDGNCLDRDDTIRQMMYMVPALSPQLTILAFTDLVKLVSGWTNSVIIVAVNPIGALTKVYPYSYDYSGAIYDMDAQLDSTSNFVYSPKIARMLPVFVRTQKFHHSPARIIRYLANNGYEINLYDTYDIHNIDALTD